MTEEDRYIYTPQRSLADYWRWAKGRDPKWRRAFFLVGLFAAFSAQAEDTEKHRQKCKCKDLPPTYQGSGSSRSSTPAPCVCPK